MLKAKYLDLNTKVERMSKFFHLILTKLTVIGIMVIYNITYNVME